MILKVIIAYLLVIGIVIAGIAFIRYVFGDRR